MAKRDYEVGHGKPPKHTRFKPGQSGNPSGKRSQKPSSSEILDGILGEKISVTEGDRKRKISKEEAFLRRVTTQALNGDRHAGKMLMSCLEKRGLNGEDPMRRIIVNIAGKDSDL